MNLPPYIQTGHVPDEVVVEAVGLFLVDGLGDPADVVDPFNVRKAYEYLSNCSDAGYRMPNESRALWEMALAAVVDENGQFIEDFAA